MKLSIKKGLSFGSTSGIITTLGLIVGLNSNTHSHLVLIGGILVIAIADAMSDALGIHISQEAENKNTKVEVWESTIATFLSKFLFSLTFLIPVLLLPLFTAIIVCIAWGVSLIIVLSYFLAKQQRINPLGVIFEHLIISAIVIVITHYVGEWTATFG